MAIILEQGKYDDKRYARKIKCKKCSSLFVTCIDDCLIHCPICDGLILTLFKPHISKSEYDRLSGDSLYRKI